MNLESGTKIKSCCLGAIEAVELAVQVGADAVGFIGRISSSSRAIGLQAVVAMTSAVWRPTETVFANFRKYRRRHRSTSLASRSFHDPDRLVSQAW